MAGGLVNTFLQRLTQRNIGSVMRSVAPFRRKRPCCDGPSRAEVQVPKMKMALSQQAAQHEKKLESMKRRTRALLTAMLPGGQNKSRSSLLVTASSPISDGGKGEVEDIWDAPLTLVRLMRTDNSDAIPKCSR